MYLKDHIPAIIQAFPLRSVSTGKYMSCFWIPLWLMQTKSMTTKVKSVCPRSLYNRGDTPQQLVSILIENQADEITHIKCTEGIELKSFFFFAQGFPSMEQAFKFSDLLTELGRSCTGSGRFL